MSMLSNAESIEDDKKTPERRTVGKIPAIRQPKVSVIIVSWNAKGLLFECLESLKNNVYDGSLEVIVVDNASTDGSADMVSQKYPDTKLICNNENLGFAKANNIGIREATGHYLALVNSDIQVLEGCISHLVAYCQSHTNAGLVGPCIIGRDGKQQISCRSAPSLWNVFCRAIAIDAIFPNSGLFNDYYMGQWDHHSIASVDILSGCFWLARRDALENVGLLDESFFIYGEDLDWCKRFNEASWDIVFVPDAQAIHYGGGSSANSPTYFFVQMQKADIQYWRKHHTWWAASLYFAISLLHHGLRIVGHSIRACTNGGQGALQWAKVHRSVACIRWLLFKEECQQRRALSLK